jgi:hypothetical protein
LKLHIIYTETELLLSKRPYASWRDIQDVHPDFKTSLGPWRDADVVAYLADEHPVPGCDRASRGVTARIGRNHRPSLRGRSTEIVGWVERSETQHF